MNYDTGMGQNKRYPHLLEADIARAGAKIDRQLRPVDLSEPELQSTGQRQDARTPIPVTAWIPHQVLWTEPLLVEAEAIAWTRSAVLVRWVSHYSVHPHHTWVWASAVSRRDP